MLKLARNRLRVFRPAELTAFYERVLGMRNFGEISKPLLGYDPNQTVLELHGGANQPLVPSKRDFYWKIGITLRDLDHAVAFIRQSGWPVSDPIQFAEIGYLCHLRDPDGFVIELLQQGFEGNQTDAGKGHPVGGQATLAHITLRINHLDQALTHCTERLGLQLVSIQPVPDYGFSLYFLAGTNEKRPVDDLKAVANREWLWKRPYSLLELQHFPEGGVESPLLEESEPGFLGLALERGATLGLEFLQPADFVPWVEPS